MKIWQYKEQEFDNYVKCVFIFNLFLSYSFSGRSEIFNTSEHLTYFLQIVVTLLKTQGFSQTVIRGMIKK